MFNIYFRSLWRIVILAIGVVAAILTVNTAVPYLDGRLPIAIVIILIYALTAYVTIPTLIRLWRIVIKPDHLPIYATTSDGWASDPVNIALVCKSRAQLIRSMENAGWSLADKGTLRNNLRTGYAILRGEHYPKATMSRLFLFNRPQDLGFQIQDGDNPSPRHRHHVRFWRLEIPGKTDDHHDFWHDLMSLFKQRRSQIWIGSATHDVALIAFRMRNLQITHKIDSDTNKERDFLIQTLRSANKLRAEPEELTSGHELNFRGQTFGVHIVVDGRLKIVRLQR